MLCFLLDYNVYFQSFLLLELRKLVVTKILLPSLVSHYEIISLYYRITYNYYTVLYY